MPLARARVGDLAPLGERALVDAQVRELPVAPVLELEGQHDEGLVGVAGERHLGLVLVEIDGVVGDLGGVGQVRRHAVEEELDRLVLVGGAHHHRRDLEVDGRLADGANDDLRGDLLLQDGLGELVGEHRQGVEHLLARLLRLVDHVGRDVALEDLLAVRALEAEGPHLDEIDHALELVFEADGELEEHRVQVQLLAELVLDALRVGAGAVALVDERDAGDAVAPHLPVDGERLRLHARDGAEHQDRAVEDAQRALHLDGEVDVARACR